MKKILIVLSLILLIFTQSCGHEPVETEKETVALPPAESESYGTEWAYAGMDKQIMADDPDFSVTGADFEYRDGWLGVKDGGYFDLACNYEPGPEERFTLEFDFYSGGGALWLGMWLYGKDSLPDDGMDGCWLKLSDGAIGYGGGTFATVSGKAVKIKAEAGPYGISVSADGEVLFSSDHKPDNGGGAVKLRSDGPDVYITNIAFRYGY